jgi:hypothetical protein
VAVPLNLYILAILQTAASEVKVTVTVPVSDPVAIFPNTQNLPVGVVPILSGP